MKYLIFDAGPIISLTMNGMLPLIEKLKEVFDGEFILTPSVKHEVVGRPMKIKKYKLEAIRVQDMIDRGVFKMSRTVVPDNKLEKEMKRLLKVTNGVLRTSQTGEKIKIIHDGEAACLAFANLCGCDNVIVIDERTTRMLTESPQNLEKMMEKKLHTPLTAELSLLDELKNFKFIRSAELLFVAYKKGLIPIKKSRDLLDALLYGVKFKGAAIASSEIEEMKRLV
jgi:predicted nucleic acid-binding protein